MEKVKNIALYLISLDKHNKVFNKKIINLKNRNCYEGNVRLNKYLHICQMVYMSMNNEKLFEEDMYAYDNGIIVEEIMQNYTLLLTKKNEDININPSIKEFLTKMYDILLDAPLEDLIKISHQDKEWIEKSKYFDKEKQKINPDNQIDNYKKMCCNFIYLMENAYS